MHLWDLYAPCKEEEKSGEDGLAMSLQKLQKGHFLKVNRLVLIVTNANTNLYSAGSYLEIIIHIIIRLLHLWSTKTLALVGKARKSYTLEPNNQYMHHIKAFSNIIDKLYHNQPGTHLLQFRLIPFWQLKRKQDKPTINI